MRREDQLGSDVSADHRRGTDRSCDRRLASRESLAIGAVIGAICGIGGRLDRAVGRFVDVLMAFPLFVLAMASAALGNRSRTSSATAFIICRLTSALRGRGEAPAAMSAGSTRRGREATAPLGRAARPAAERDCRRWRCKMSLNLGWAILNAAGRSFTRPRESTPTPGMGIMVAEGARLFRPQWWMVAFQVWRDAGGSVFQPARGRGRESRPRTAEHDPTLMA